MKRLQGSKGASLMVEAIESSMNFSLFVTDMRPNGTRDLIVSNPEGTVIDVCSEALFGGPKDWNETPYTYLDQDSIVAIDAGTSDEYAMEYMEPVWNADLKHVIRYTAISPLDPKGEALRTFLKQYGVNIPE